jgi:aspartate carbamoyltransferase catalytic subunit
MARVVAGKCRAIVMRHPTVGSADELAKYAHVPVFNGGDGIGQHPSQALLDLYTIIKRFGKIDGLQIAMVGDLLNGRTVRSLCYLLALFPGVKIYFVSPAQLRMKDDIKRHLDEHGVEWCEESDLEAVAAKVHVIYQTRIQKEWFSDIHEYEAVSGIYVINKHIVGLMRPDGIIMHPLPIVDEVMPEVDELPQAYYFEQADNGDYVRMALLLAALNPEKAEQLLESAA